MVYRESFICCVKVGGKIMRDNGGEVVLPFGSEFSVLLKNKESRKAVVSVEIDGQDVLNGKQLIVDSNSSMELEGFLDGYAARNKFKFIQKTKEIAEFRGDRADDGMIRVAFRYERQQVDVPIVHYTPYWPHNHHWPTYYPLTSNGYGVRSLTSNASCPTPGGNAISSVFSCSVTQTSSMPVSQPAADEGITVKGSQICQNFNVGSTRQLEDQEHVIIITLKGTTVLGLPVSSPVTVVTKSQCEVCGRFFKFGTKFCSNCGNCLAV